MDPTLTFDGKDYATERFDKIIKERYYITKFTNTSYIDAGKLTPRERQGLLDLITDDLKREKEIHEKLKSQKKGKK